MTTCPFCRGTGGPSLLGADPCPDCAGTGELPSPSLRPRVPWECPRCGAGLVRCIGRALPRVPGRLTPLVEEWVECERHCGWTLAMTATVEEVEAMTRDQGSHYSTDTGSI